MLFDFDALSEEVAFSRTAAGWVDIAQLDAFQRGELSAAELLAGECDRRGVPAPTGDEIASFTADLEQQQQAIRDTIEAFGHRVGFFAGASTANMAERLGVKMPRPEPLRFPTPQVSPGPLVSMVEQQQRTIAVLQKVATDAERANKRAERSDRRNTVILVTTAAIALAALLLGLFGVHL